MRLAKKSMTSNLLNCNNSPRFRSASTLSFTGDLKSLFPSDRSEWWSNGSLGNGKDTYPAAISCDSPSVQFSTSKRNANHDIDAEFRDLFSLSINPIVNME
jgi:hypothetical protein